MIHRTVWDRRPGRDTQINGLGIISCSAFIYGLGYNVQLLAKQDSTRT